MSKRGQETQGGEERYGFSNGPGGGDMADKPQQANAAQMARRKIAQVKKAGASNRSSRANTPTANPFAPQQQSMASFQIPQSGGDGGGSAFNFSMNSGPSNNPFQNANGATPTPPPTFGANPQSNQQNGGGGMFGNNNTSFGSTFGSNASTQPQSNGLSFGAQNNTNGNSNPFAFGSNNQNQPQQNGATPNSNTSSFTGFGQANGNANTPFQFGNSQQQTQSTQGTSFGSLGQNQQSNGDKPAPSFGGLGQSNQQQNGDKPATPFMFGASTQQTAEKPATPSFGGFGQTGKTQSQTNGEKSSIFGTTQQSQQTPQSNSGSLFTFNSQNQGIGNKKPTPEPSTQPTETPKAPTGGLFGAQQSTGKGLFGATPPPQESSGTVKPGDSIFSAQSKPKLGGNLFTSDMAEGKRPESPAPTFGHSAQQKPAATDPDQTPKPNNNNIFGGFGQSQANAVQDTPKPSSNLFSASSFGQTPAQPAAASKNMFNQSVQDTSMHTPGDTPQKSSLFTPAASQQNAPPAGKASASETAAPSGSLFDRIKAGNETPATAQKDSEQPRPEQPAATPAPSFGGTSGAPSTAQKPLFSSSNNLFNTPAPQPKTSTDLFSKPADQAALSATPRAPSLSAKGPATQPPATSQPARAASNQRAPTTADVIPDNEKDTFKVLNEGLMAHLGTQDPTADWTTIMEYYLKQAAVIRHKPAPDLKALSAAPSSTATPAQSMERSVAPSAARTSEENAPSKKAPAFGQSQPAVSSESASSDMFGSSFAAAPKAPASFQRNAFSDAQQTPKPSLFQPPATAPVNRKRSADEEAERPPATEKRARAAESTAYPKLPDNASDVSKAFYSALENKSAGASLFSPKINGVTSESAAKDDAGKDKAHQAPASAGVQVMGSGSGGFTPSGSGFNPSTSGFKPSTSGFKPSTSGFTPSMPSGGASNFMAAFGKRASEQQEADRKKRKAEDYDSDEETEEQWAERDKKAQEEKRAKVMEDAKASSGFMFKAAPKAAEKSSSSGSKEKKDDPPADGEQGRGLFDRIGNPDAAGSDKPSPSLFSAATPASKTPTSNIFRASTTTTPKPGLGSSLFGHLAKSTSNDSSKATENAERGETVEKQTQGTGDNTWNEKTPIKFGTSTTDKTSTTPAAPPPAFGNLFGTKSQTSSSSNTGLLNVPGSKPAMGFNFGAQPSSAGGSRATTPGVTTDGEGTGTSNAGDADNEPSDNPPADEPQVEDMTGLGADETKGETLLYTVAMSKASKWEEKKTDDGSGTANGWVDKGKGPLYLLKNDETGKVRILLKVPPYGNARMNFPMLKGGDYKVQGKTGKQITGSFWDHLADKPGLGKWLVQVGKKEDADEVGRILAENEPK